MNHPDELQSMIDPQETLDRLCRKAATKVNREKDLTETSRALLMCVLSIREFGRTVRNSIAEDGAVFGGFKETVQANVYIPADEVWASVDQLTECVLDGIGVLEKFDPEAAESHNLTQSLLSSLMIDRQGDLQAT